MSKQVKRNLKKEFENSHDQQFLVKHLIEQVQQPLYSPDIGLCVFFLSPKQKFNLKCELWGRRRH